MNLAIAVDFDGTCVTHEFPKIGQEVGAVPVLRDLVAKGHRLILFTMRSDVTAPVSDDPHIACEPGDYLTQAVQWFAKHDIPLWGIQTNPTQHELTTSPKAYAHLYLDDAALGMPLVTDVLPGMRPYVDWDAVRVLLEQRGIL